MKLKVYYLMEKVIEDTDGKFVPSFHTDRENKSWSRFQYVTNKFIWKNAGQLTIYKEQPILFSIHCKTWQVKPFL